MNIQITDQEWDFLSHHLSHRPKRKPHSKGRPQADDRQLFEGIVWILVNGGRWRDLPRPQYPAKSSCHRRFATWCRDGSWQRVQRKLIKMLGGRGKIDIAEGFVDGTQVKAKKGAFRLGRAHA